MFQSNPHYAFSRCYPKHILYVGNKVALLDSNMSDTSESLNSHRIRVRRTISSQMQSIISLPKQRRGKSISQPVSTVPRFQIQPLNISNHETTGPLRAIRGLNIKVLASRARDVLLRGRRLRLSPAGRNSSPISTSIPPASPEAFSRAGDRSGDSAGAPVAAAAVSDAAAASAATRNQLIKLIALLLLVIQNASTVLCVRCTRVAVATGAAEPYISSTAVVVAEGLKLATCLAILCATQLLCPTMSLCVCVRAV